ncbi:DUF559 domain-containing protein [Nocardioides sp. MAH-18]|uniref:DUF559 domain-containing protein n=1 Tax=Nocardioides agri TaxID=2682843 RepID=A0A6L6XTA2_9ACTN|nr:MULTISPECIES: DUF559 domain-containing protein [unclassified Nocardioides]MBA2955388.1 DUF559 domain-containing protein [Nocardioides sp. CGMCC 1.13656]MVQ50238.1 DUF559 domain-containing protein [Nocardioides sp. MAH-18]
MGIQWPGQPFTRGELDVLGIPPSRLRRALRAAEVRPVVRGVFVPAHLDDTLDLRIASVAKAVRPHQVVTDRTAAWLHGVDAHVYAEHDGVPAVEVCALRWHAPTKVEGVDGRTRDLRPEDVMMLGGVRVTTPLRTALDLGCCLRRREAFGVLVMMARLHGISATEYERTLGRYRRRRGVVQLRELVGSVDPRLESHREAWVLLAIVDAGLPLPEPQVWVEIGGVPTYRLDLAYRRRRVCVEYDGAEAHAGRQAYDEERRGWLRDHGWTVIVLHEGDFSGEALDRWLRELRAALDPTYTNRRW